MDNLVARLEDSRKPPVDIVHFDGHGALNIDGRLHERAKHSDRLATKGDHKNNGNMGYLLFEDKEGKTALGDGEEVSRFFSKLENPQA